MKRGYSNPMVTYEEIVNALKAIIECSLNDSYVDSFDILNVKYDNEKIEEYSDEAEKALYKAIKSLDKTIDAANKIIKINLEKDLEDIETSILTLRTSFYTGQELRKLSAQDQFIEKLTGASLPIDILYEAPLHSDEDIEEEEEVIEEIEEPVEVEEETPTEEEPIPEDTNKVLSKFEQSAVDNFPEYFKEEIDLANDEDPLDVSDLFDTMELDPVFIADYQTPEKLEPPLGMNFNEELKVMDLPNEDVIDFKDPVFEISEEDEPPKIEFEDEPEEKTASKEPVVEKPKPVIGDNVDKEKVQLLKKALIKAKEKGDEVLIKRLKKQLSRELGISK